MEPYERSAWWVSVFILAILVVAVVMGANPFASVGITVGMVALSWMTPLLIDKIKAKTANHHHVGNLGLKSCYNPKPLATTADDPKTGMPGLRLFTFGGGGGSGFHLKDGGTSFNSGGYFYEPIDAAIELDGGTMVHPCLFQEVRFDTLLPQFQTAAEENGIHPANTRFYGSIVHVGSVKPPSVKMLNEEAIMLMKEKAAAESRQIASDVMGAAASNMDLIDRINASRRGMPRKLKKALGQEEEEERDGP
jgi:hypothetical protein